MSIVVLQLPKVKRKTNTRPAACSYCKGALLQRWGGTKKRLRDPKVHQVKVYRYRCCSCRRTFRDYPAGVGRARQSERLRKLAVVCWTLGLSYRSLALILGALGMPLSRMTGWRNVQAEAEQIRTQNRWKPVRILGLDGAYLRAGGQTRPVLVAVDLGDGQPVAIGYVDESNPQAVRRWLEPLVKRLEVSAIVTDDLSSYRKIADDLQLAHQVCQFHLRRWVGRALYHCQKEVPPEWQGVIGEVGQTLDQLSPEGSRRLYALWKQMPGRTTAPGEERTPLEKLRDLLLRLGEHWERYRLFFEDPQVPWTNNATEQVIGRMKMRSRTVRGYKTQAGMLNGLLVAGTSLS